ncbi:hypothetical protein ACH41E_01710 [Streptomyces sp. NPDC020412]|uniref:hypothetical protein n=1 Tax=Streptomyces sp. NPDC020412 TaxID=3365073 RepID=UPI0037AA0F77
MPGADPLRTRSYELFRLAPGSTVVDVGCGAGRAAAEPARASGAIDRDQADAWLAEQRGRAETGRFLVAIPFVVASASA